MLSPSSLTVPIYFVRSVLKNIPPNSESWNKLLQDARITPEMLNGAEGRARVSIAQFARIQINAMKLLNDEMLGYSSKPLPVGCWEMMSYACISANTLGDAAERYCRFYNLMDWDLKAELWQDGSHETYTLTPKEDRVLDPYAYELCLLNSHRFFSWIIGRSLPLSRVNLTYAPPKHADLYRLLFPNIPVFFDQEFNGFEFQHQSLSLPLAQNSTSLRKFLRHPGYHLMVLPLEEQSWSSKIQKIIGKNVACAPAFNLLADQLEIHPQTLRRRLTEEGTTYRDIKNHLRRDTSIYYLAKPGLSIEEVSERSGFAETSSFIRAFKNWTGLTPHCYRKKVHQNDD